MAEEDLGSIRTRKAVMAFAVPSIVMMVFTSTYSIVDGFFVSNMISTDALAAVNLLMPAVSLFTAMGFMFATGGSAYVANLLGRGKAYEARASFSLIYLALLAITIVIMVFCLAFLDRIVDFLGADDELRGMATDYARVIVLASPLMTLQFVCTQFLIVAGRPKLALLLSVSGGMSNIFLDWLFMGPFDMGIGGAAVASAIGGMVPTLGGTAYFLLKKDSSMHFAKPSRNGRVLYSTCTNGVSEMASELSGAVTSLLLNLTMMDYIGADGVSAITIMEYAQFLAIAAVIGYSNGVAPVMSFNHGADDRKMMSSLFRYSTQFALAVSVAAFLLLEIFGDGIVSLFANGSDEVQRLASDGAVIFSFGFLFMGLNVYASSLFTSLSNGIVSAIISAFRSLIVLVPMILALPALFGIDSIWYAIPLTEVITCALAFGFVYRLGPRYGFLETKKPQKA